MRKYLLYLNLSFLILFSSLVYFIQYHLPPENSEGNSSQESAVPDDFCEEPVPMFHINLNYRGHVFRINSWQSESGQHYLFLPRILCSETETLSPETEFPFEAAPSSPQTLYSSNLPVLWIETGSGELKKINASKEYVSSVSVSLLSSSDRHIDFQSASLHARGNVSFDLAPKKSYLLEMESETDLLGMGSAKKWVLTSNFFDQTSLRNYLTLYLSKELGLTYVPDFHFVDVYVNGSYLGVYLITEKVEVAPQRVAIPDLETENVARNGQTMLSKYPYRSDHKMGFRAKSPSDITGGYLVEFELDERWSEEESGFVTEDGQHVVIQSPKHATIAEINYIQSLFQAFEDSLLDTDVDDSSYQEYIDLDSFVKKYLVEELSKNIDANKTSQFFYKYPDSISQKLYAGPPWDYDKAWGNGTKLDTDLDLRDPTQLYASRHIYPHSIWAQLYDKESFQTEVRSCFFSQARPLMERILTDSLPQWKEMIYDSSRMDWIRWNDYRKFGTDNLEQKYVASFDQAYDELVEFVRLRTDFLAAEWSH